MQLSLSLRVTLPIEVSCLTEPPATQTYALLVALRREDVVLPGDLALRKAIRTVYALDHLPTQDEVLQIAEKWRPYRSLATSYLFNSAYQEKDKPTVRRRDEPRRERDALR